jgi:hypothetical protein
MDQSNDPNQNLNPLPPESAHQPGQVIGPTGSPNSEIAQPPSVDVPQVIQTMPTEEASRPMAVATPQLPTDGVILPPQAAVINGQNFDQPKKPFLKKFAGKKLAFLALPILLLGGSAAAYIGYYVPNQPDNIWATALANTGKGYDKLSDFTQQQFDNPNKTLKMDGNFKTTGSFVADGDFKGSSDANNGEFTGNLSTQGAKVSLDVRAIKSSGDTPDLYFKLDGLQGIGTLLGGDPTYANALNSVNGNWYVVDHSLFDQYVGAATPATSLQFSKNDVKAVLDAVGNASKQNIFTKDTSKMAFVVKQKIGKELKSLVSGDSSNVLSIALSCSNLESNAANVNETRTADVWVDTRTKLIHKVRFTEPSNKDNYFDVGQDYQGGDSIPFIFTTHSKDNGITSDGTVTLTLNTKTNTIAIKGSGQDSGSDNFGGSFSLNVSRSNDTVKVEKPASSKTIVELLNDLGLDGFIDGANSTAADAERKTDINALHGQLEAYQALNGRYPSLAEMNDPSWRSKNLQGLDGAALQDPAGSTKTLVAAPAAHSYSYQATPAGCDNASKGDCTGYTLTATLDDGGTYVKQALNDASFDQPTILQ